MTKFLISFPAWAMNLSEADLTAAGVDSRAVIEEAKAAGVYVFGGGIAEDIAPTRIAADGSRSDALYEGTPLTGGFTILELSTRADAEHWAQKIAAACRCDQEIREFMYDPAS